MTNEYKQPYIYTHSYQARYIQNAIAHDIINLLGLTVDTTQWTTFLENLEVTTRKGEKELMSLAMQKGAISVFGYDYRVVVVDSHLRSWGYTRDIITQLDYHFINLVEKDLAVIKESLKNKHSLELDF